MIDDATCTPAIGNARKILFLFSTLSLSSDICSTMEEIVSSRGGKIVKHNGYLFYINKSRNENQYYRCENKSCRARLVMKNGTITSTSKCSEHSHPPNIKKECKRKFFNEIKKRSIDRPSEPVPRIYREMVDEVAHTEEVASCLPALKTASTFMYKARKKSAKCDSSEQNVYNPNFTESDELIVPDVEMQCSGISEVETQSSSSTNLLGMLSFGFKQEIAETEEESSTFYDSSLAGTQSGIQTPNKSYLTHSESFNSNAENLPVGQVREVPTMSSALSIDKVEPGVSTNSCNKISKTGEWSENSLKAESTQPNISSHVTNSSFPSFVNVAAPSSISNTAVKPEPSFSTALTPLPQVADTTSQGNSEGNSQPSDPQNFNQSFPPKDKFDAYGEFIASKLRNLDAKSCNFVQAAFADLIFKAELGMFFLSKSDIPAPQANEILKDGLLHSRSVDHSNVENIKPSYGDTRLPPNFDVEGSGYLQRDEPLQPSDSSIITNKPFPSVPNNTDSDSSLRSEPNQDKTMSCAQNQCPTPVMNIDVSENLPLNNSTQIRLPSNIDPPHLPPVLNQENSFRDMPFQSKYQNLIRPRDEFDAFGEFAASKLRALDPRSCARVQTAFADLIFQAELGRFLNRGERGILANRTNEIFSNMPTANTSAIHSL